MDGHVLVTGGAGYVGSHVVRRLHEQGRRVVALDTLESGSRTALPDGVLVAGDVADRALVRDVLRRYAVKSVLHVAAYTRVAESVADPGRYYRNNAGASRALVECCVAAGVEHFVFSSSAAVYGTPDAPRVDEGAPARPINPYGASKLMTERMLRDVAAATGMRCTTLRCFNVAGADPQGRMGPSRHHAASLVKAACEAALGRRDHLPVHGTDFPTRDGTCVRDYVHVEDVAGAYLRALGSLEAGGGSQVLNCGGGRGASVLEVVAAVERAAGVAIDARAAPRRAGDPPSLVADVTRIRARLEWAPRHPGLAPIVESALEWERRLCESPRRAHARSGPRAGG